MYIESRIAQLFLIMLKIIYIHGKKVFSSIHVFQIVSSIQEENVT
jgi:hypothetical protein